MFSRLKTRKVLVVILVGIILGCICAKWLVQGNPLVTIPWGICAFLSAFVASDRREALTLGGTLGFVASYSYLWFDHSGGISAGQALALIFLIVLPALFGLICGMLCALLGWMVSSKTVRKQN